MLRHVIGWIGGKPVYRICGGDGTDPAPAPDFIEIAPDAKYKFGDEVIPGGELSKRMMLEADYRRKTAEIAPDREFLDFVKSDPGFQEHINSYFNTEPAQATQQAPGVDPQLLGQVDFLQQGLMHLYEQNQHTQLKQQFGEAYDQAAVGEYVRQRQIGDMEVAFRALQYDKLPDLLNQARQQALAEVQQGQQAALQSGQAPSGALPQPAPPAPKNWRDATEAAKQAARGLLSQ